MIRAVLFGMLALAVSEPARAQTVTPIHHIIVLFQENISFDHYFATYPQALNLPGEHPFRALPDTPSVNGIDAALAFRNPNSARPFRLPLSVAATCDMDHEYTAEQKAFDGGLMDAFIENTGAESGEQNCDRRTVMGYFDGNTVTALWNYAQHFALADNSFGTVLGPSTPGAINLISGNTHGAVPADLVARRSVVTIDGTLIGDGDPAFDDCSNPKSGLVEMRGRTIGDLLDARHVTWGWFQGGFRPTEIEQTRAVCAAASVNLTGATVPDYSPHHEPFQYFRRWANPHHLPPAAPERIGFDDQANHQYDLSDFYEALESGHLPAVSFVKAKRVGDGHAGFGYSNPLDEQRHLVAIVNAIGRSHYWQDTAIIIAYDDSDGWYDHVMPPIVNGSATPVDALNGPGRCGKAAPGDYPARCGYGPRLPLLVISPFARVNSVDHRLTDQTSILRLIEDNWSLGRIGDQSFDAIAGSLLGMFDFTRRDPPLILDPATGEPVR